MSIQTIEFVVCDAPHLDCAGRAQVVSRGPGDDREPELPPGWTQVTRWLAPPPPSLSGFMSRYVVEHFCPLVSG